MVAPRDITVAVLPAAWLQQDAAGPEWSEISGNAREHLRDGYYRGPERETWQQVLIEAETDQYQLIEAYGEALAVEVRAAAMELDWAGAVEVIIWTTDGEEPVPGATETKGSLTPHSRGTVEAQLALHARVRLVVDQHKGSWRIRRRSTGEVLWES